MAKPKRNDPCPCGSGRKYKKCCLSKDEASLVPTDGSARHDPTFGRQVGERLGGAVHEMGEGKSARAIAEGLRQQGVPFSPYTVMRLCEDPRSAGESSHLRRLIERGIGAGWTTKKVAAMTTLAIEKQLAALGVRYSREHFVQLASDRHSAWTIAEVWLERDSVRCSATEDDFLGLAACELWKRLVPGRPSTEMADDWMQEGYDLIERDEIAGACDIWWKVWCILRPRFGPELRTMNAVEDAFGGRQSVFNWCQDFEMHLGNVARKDRRYAPIGRQYCIEWMAQFPDEHDGMQVTFRRALASFLSLLGEVDEVSVVLHGLPREWPKNPWSYIALADAHAHFFAPECDLPFDLGKAIGYLEQGLAAVSPTDRDRDVLEERLAELRAPSYKPSR